MFFLKKIKIFLFKKNKSNIEIIDINKTLLNDYYNLIIIFNKIEIYKKITNINLFLQKRFNINYIKKKEIIYLYKINRLLQRSKNIFFIYNKMINV
ncbi:MAG: hypothetical protein NHG07_00975 [Candidatus Shikimatogenerans bostrichidophilus]|nr:MAG: hypothetical protein NHG07_00975 [Candidatus Shikimatogenerans bostrichidophilus]